MPRLIEVALHVPVFSTFTYRADPTLDIALGHRVVVPFQNRRALGVVVGLSAPAEPGRTYKEVTAVPDAAPAFSAPLLRTCRWLAEYYVTPLGVVLRSALPAALGSAAKPTPGVRRHRVIALARRLDSLLERDQVLRRAPRQRVLYEYLETLAGPVPVEHVVKQLAITEAVVAGLVQRGLATVRDETVDRDPLAARDRPMDGAFAPTPAQSSAVETIAALRPGSVALLHGVTGSGKTLVYVEVLKRLLRADAVRAGQGPSSAIVLVPEIALTPQTVDRFRAAFGDQVAVLHSALGEGERLDAWMALKRGEKRIVVGARSAVFAPVQNVAVIVVDEEHETSYKQGEAPRYHARDVAVMRARHEGARVILGSATPSLESWQLVDRGRYTLVRLPDRVGGGRLPSVEVLDLRRSPPSGGGGSAELLRGPPPDSQDTHTQSRARHALPQLPASATATPDAFRRVISKSLEEALHECLARAEQAILLLNRRGYASFMQCADCGDVAVCQDCSVALTLHRAPLPGRLACHYCGRSEEPRVVCARCGGQTVRQRGLGTQQVERLLIERFATARVARMDVDTTTGKWAHVEILDRVAAGHVDILLGTQMIAKGLDFPNVTLVGVVDADVGMNIPDFRAAERTFQLLTQVSGRAGRAAKAGRVIIQTRLPTHHAVQCALTHDVPAFIETELAARRSPAYPPWTRLAHVVLSGPDEAEVAEAAQRAARWLRTLIGKRALQGLQVIGPAPAPVERIQQRWRWRLLVRSESSTRLTQLLTYLATRFKLPSAHLRLTIDRDPQSLL